MFISSLFAWLDILLKWFIKIIIKLPCCTYIIKHGPWSLMHIYYIFKMKLCTSSCLHVPTLMFNSVMKAAFIFYILSCYLYKVLWCLPYSEFCTRSDWLKEWSTPVCVKQSIHLSATASVLKISKHLWAHNICYTCCEQMQKWDNWGLGLCVIDRGCWVHCQILQSANSTSDSCVNMPHILKHWKCNDLKQLQVENYKCRTPTTTKAN